MDYLYCMPDLNNTRENCEKIHNILARMSDKYKLILYLSRLRQSILVGLGIITRNIGFIRRYGKSEATAQKHTCRRMRKRWFSAYVRTSRSRSLWRAVFMPIVIRRRWCLNHLMTEIKRNNQLVWRTERGGLAWPLFFWLMATLSWFPGLYGKIRKTQSGKGRKVFITTIRRVMI